MTVVEREKRKGEKAKGAEFEPRRSQNFLLKPLLPEAFPSRQGGDIKPGLIRRALACANRGLKHHVRLERIYSCS